MNDATKLDNSLTQTFFPPANAMVVLSAATILEPTLNAVVKRGDRIVAYCASSDVDDIIEFTHHTDTDNFTVYDNGSVSHPDTLEAHRYSLTYESSVDTARRAVLEITSAEPSDAGTFSCRASGSNTEYLFELTILGK